MSILEFVMIAEQESVIFQELEQGLEGGRIQPGILYRHVLYLYRHVLYLYRHVLYGVGLRRGALLSHLPRASFGRTLLCMLARERGARNLKSKSPKGP